MLKKAEAQLQEELRQRKDTAEHYAKLNAHIQTLLAEKESAPELSRKVSYMQVLNQGGEGRRCSHVSPCHYAWGRGTQQHLKKHF